MSRQTKDELIAELTFEVRAAQGAVDQMDGAACRALGVNRTAGRCIDVIDREGPVAAGRLAEASGLTTAAVTAVIDRLERAGYARRVGDPNDRRRVLVELTPLLRERAEVVWGPFGVFGEILSRYTVEQLELLRDYHRIGREYNEARAAEVRKLRFDRPSEPPHRS
ncbi:MAG TPA: MarR family transcriptional regulator [Solirubrobacteraceae bacterium]|jgi:DNA-binding MarR family transcriptional regulator|nr:MarR family transcriptional regulator [Solirubrobacteraceae bacterium]